MVKYLYLLFDDDIFNYIFTVNIDSLRLLVRLKFYITSFKMSAR